MGDPNLTARRASRILRDRGIRGVLVGPLASGESSLDLEWTGSAPWPSVGASPIPD